jgi:small-conductance mechanosensitive channel
MRLKHDPHAPQLLLVWRYDLFASKIVLYLFILAMFALAVGLGFALRQLVRRFRSGTKTSWGNLAVSVLEELPIPLLVLGAVYVTMRSMLLPGGYEQAASKLIFALVVLVVFFFINRVTGSFIHHVGLREPALERITQPAAFVVKLLSVILATVIILENLGIHLVAVWTTLGVGSIAVALGLQETLSNAFAGFYIMADQPVAPGDYVKLDTGQEGYVVRTGWRATSLRTLSNNLVYIPNSSLAKAVITNYSKPEERMSLVIPVSVSYGTDPRRVESLLLEIAREAARDGVDGLLPHPEPSVRLIPGFGASSLDFSLAVQLRRFVDQYFVQSELRKRILDRFAKERIDMPFPTSTILFDPLVTASITRHADGSSGGRSQASDLKWP